MPLASALLLTLAPATLLAQQYFPPGVLDSKATGYSSQLQALREPSLWELSLHDPSAEVYRFVWLRPFDHPITVRLVVRTSGSGWIHSRMTSGKGGYRPGRITRYGVSWLTKAKTQSWVAAFENAGFWTLPTLPGPGETAGADNSAEWIFEGVKKGQYHVIDRCSPDVGDPVRALGLTALKLARFRIRARDVD